MKWDVLNAKWYVKQTHTKVYLLQLSILGVDQT